MLRGEAAFVGGLALLRGRRPRGFGRADRFNRDGRRSFGVESATMDAPPQHRSKRPVTWHAVCLDNLQAPMASDNQQGENR